MAGFISGAGVSCGRIFARLTGGYHFSHCGGGAELAISQKVALIALDLDGTAVQSTGEVSPRLQKAVSQALTQGVRVILATGRMVQSARPFWEALALPEGPLVAYQGAVVALMPSGSILSETTLPDKGARIAVKWALQRHLLVQVYINTELWVSREDERVRRYIDANHIPAWVRGENELTAWPDPPIKILLQDEPGVLDRIRQDLAALIEPFPIRVFKSQSDYLELVSNKVGKAFGLAAAAKQLGVSREQVMAIGDAENDMDMLAWAGIGVAMGQAPDAVKGSAKYVTDPVDEDGAAHAIERFVL